MSVRAPPPPPEGDLFAHFGVVLERRSEPLAHMDGVVDGRPCANCRWLVALDAERCPLCGRAMDPPGERS